MAGKFNKIFDDAKDKNVATVLITVDEDGYALPSESAEEALSCEELKELYFKGCLIIDTGVYYAPLSLTVDETGEEAYAALAYGSNSSAYSKEYVDPEVSEDLDPGTDPDPGNNPV